MAEFEFEPEPQKLTLGESVARLQQIQSGLKQAVANLHGKLMLLDSEAGLEELRRDAEVRAADLEAEVKRLRMDLKSVKDLLGSDSEKKKSAQT
jgi:LPS O-antigen subunit length determinant protein (WzzB/FepE family)